ncbi:MAG: hypothetical protein ABI619_02810 [Betaproteobacteria bacterium]
MATKKKKSETQASFIRGCLARKHTPQSILKDCARRFPKGKVTAGYIGWLAKRAKASRLKTP